MFSVLHRLSKTPMLACLLGLLCVICQAQQPSLPLTTQGSAKGIFVAFNHSELIGKEIDVYRKGKNDADFQKIATLAPLRSQEELRQRIAAAKTVFASYAQPSDKNVTQAWGAYQKNPAQLAGIIAFIPQLAYVFNLAYWDTDVRVGQTYQYQIRSSQKTVASSTAYTYTGNFAFPKFQLVKDTALQKNIRLDFLYSPTLLYYVDWQVKRKQFTEKNNAYKPLSVQLGTSRQGKDRYVSMTDTSLREYSSYHYQIRQRSIFGQTDTAVMYAVASNVSPLMTPSLIRFAATPEKQQRALHIGWRFSNPSLIQSVSLYRSTDPDNGFTLAGSFNAADTATTSGIQEANELYFYRLEFTDLFGNRQKSSAIHASYTGHTVPLAPHQVEYTLSRNQVELHWQPSDAVTRGYYVYRRKGMQGEFLQLSAFIPASVISFRDSTRLEPSETYYYALKAESDTYDKSALSDTVAVRVENAVSELKPPTDIAAVYRDGKVELVWENMTLQNPQVFGYQVFRKKEGEIDYTLLTPQPLAARGNRFVDSTVAAANYSYSIVSTDATGQQSKPGIAVTIETATQRILLPERLGYEKSATAIKVKWTSLDTRYLKEIRVYRAQDNQLFQLLSKVSQTMQNFTDNTVSKGHLYSYRITTIDAQGTESRPSPIVSVDYE